MLIVAGAGTVVFAVSVVVPTALLVKLVVLHF